MKKCVDRYVLVKDGNGCRYDHISLYTCLKLSIKINVGRVCEKDFKISGNKMIFMSQKLSKCNVILNDKDKYKQNACNFHTLSTCIHIKGVYYSHF